MLTALVQQLAQPQASFTAGPWDGSSWDRGRRVRPRATGRGERTRGHPYNASSSQRSHELARSTFDIWLAVVGGLVLYLPFFLWFRWRSRASRKRGDSARGFRVTRFGAGLYGATLAAVLAGLGSGHLAPESWLGAQVRTLFGAFGFVSAVCVVSSAIERFLLKRGIVFAYHMVTSNPPSEQAAEGSDHA